MTFSRWFRRHHSSPPRPARRTARLMLEGLETRITPTVLLTYNGAGTPLALTESSPGNDQLTVSEISPGLIQIELGAGSGGFDPNSSTIGVSYFDGGGFLRFARVNIGTAGAISSLGIDSGAGTDTLRLGMTNANGGVERISVSKSSPGALTTFLNSVTLPGGALSISGGPILLASGVGIFTNGGAISLTGTGTSAIPSGVQLIGATLDAGGGNIVLAGSSAGGTSHTYGVYTNGSLIRTAGAGTVTLRGAGGAGLDYNQGVVANGQSAILTVDGELSVVGGSRGTRNFNNGINITSGTVLQATGLGRVIFTGTGATGNYNNSAIVVSVGAQVKSVHGDISFAGTGTGYGSDNYGIFVQNGAIVEATGRGKISFTGFGGAGTTYNFGVVLFTNTGQAPQVRTAGGDLTIVGTGRGTGNDNYGIDLETGAIVRVVGGGRLNMTGTAGNGTNYSSGVIINSRSQVFSVHGDTVITGTGAGTGNFGFGVEALGGSIVQTLGTGKLYLFGTGGAGRDFNHGVVVLGAGTQVRTASADLVFSGQGRGSLGHNLGISVDTGALVFASGTGRIFLQSQATAIAIASGSAVRALSGDIFIHSGGNMNVAYGAVVQSSGAGKIQIVVDSGNVRPGIGTVASIAVHALRAPSGVSIVGGPDADTFYIVITGTGITSRTNTGPGSGTFTFTTGQVVAFASFETIAAVP